MIRVEEITIKEFRGIRDLTLTPQGKNFAVCGSNGTGKSGIVDALEFALTGNISRLEGEGMGKISVAKHGPHVDSKDNPERASVTLKVFIPSLKKSATIHRTIKNAADPEIKPDSPDIKAVINEVGVHPEFALSRRQIIRYVIAEPGKRDKDVQALLRLDAIGAMRGKLQTIANASKKSSEIHGNAEKRASEELATAMEIAEVTAQTILDAANKRRALLSLPELTKLSKETTLTEGLSIQSDTPTVEKIQKSIALSDMKALNDQLQAVTSANFQNICASANQAVAALQGEDLGKDGATKEELLQDALRLYNQEVCPVCDTEWDPEEFRAHIKEKLKKLEAGTKKREAAAKKLESIANDIDKLLSLLRPIYKYAGLLSTPCKTDNISAYGKSANAAVIQLRKVLPIADTLKALDAIKSLPNALLQEIQQIEENIKKLPEASAEDAARRYLIIAQERLEKLREAASRYKKSKVELQTAVDVLDIYNSVTTKALEKIYKDVEELFKKLYRLINDDEDKFAAQLIPSAGKLGFDVNFYGRGFFPPGAYHSEGHQDAMGLCLYLALMKHLLGANFVFAVLDDVLMSVDSGHRREVSKMLKEQFPNTQFILTTHDEVWLRAMKSSGLVQTNQAARFKEWSVDLGPTEWDDLDVWKEIAAHLAKNDVRAAAGLLRHYLEHMAGDICDNLKAMVEFRGDGQYMLGDLMPNAIGALNKQLKTAIASANSWGDDDGEVLLSGIQTDFVKAIAISQVESWQINAAVHFNAWANLDKKDFKPVADAFKNLLSYFSCSDCGGLLYLVSNNRQPETLKCGCPKTNFNLLKKAKDAEKGAA